MAGEPSKRRSVRQAVSRKRSLYVDPDTDDDFALAEAPSSDSPAPEADEDDEPTPPKKAKTSDRRSGRPPQRETRSKAAKKATNPQSPQKRATNRSKHTSKSTKDTPAMPDIPSDGIIPKWQSLPYAILSQIFAYAFAAELETEDGTVANRRVHHPNTWILRTARKVCHDFAEPALTAFYQSPKLLAHRWLEDLTNLVEQPQESLAFKYKMKIKFLELSSMHLESKTNESLLPRLVGQLPQLSELVITHPQDEPPFELRSRSVRWKYPLELFDVLDRSNMHLNNWRWNWHLMKEDITGQPWVESNVGHFLNSIHKRSSFQSIQHLTISHLPSVPPFPELIESEEDPAGVALAEAICILPELRSLSFESCDCLTNQFLQGLPENLEKLKIVNCATLTSDMLYDFLARNGSSYV